MFCWLLVSLFYFITIPKFYLFVPFWPYKWCQAHNTHFFVTKERHMSYNASIWLHGSNAIVIVWTETKLQNVQVIYKSHPLFWTPIYELAESLYEWEQTHYWSMASPPKRAWTLLNDSMTRDNCRLHFLFLNFICNFKQGPIGFHVMLQSFTICKKQCLLYWKEETLFLSQIILFLPDLTDF